MFFLIFPASPFWTLTAMLLVTLQCTKRFIETSFLQIFSKKSKINLTHYMCGYLHYYGLVVLIIAKSDGFNSNQQDDVTLDFTIKDMFFAIIACMTFIFLCLKQFESNMIFINLRKSKSGKIVTENHLLPHGGWFKYVTSPHMTTEIGMYLVLYAVLSQNSSYLYCLTWVLANQIGNALVTHKWYLTTFKNYPKERKALIPYIL